MVERWRDGSLDWVRVRLYHRDNTGDGRAAVAGVVFVTESNNIKIIAQLSVDPVVSSIEIHGREGQQTWDGRRRVVEWVEEAGMGRGT